MSRSAWKPLTLHPEFINQYQKALKGEEVILLNRCTLLTKEMLGIRISVYNGVRFFSFTVDKGKLGYCVGEFAPTRKKPIQKKKKK